MNTETGAPSGGTELVYVCAECGRPFEAADGLLTLLPLFVPQRCLACSNRPPRPAPPAAVDAILQGPGQGPNTGVFVAASCYPDPGPGAWAAVRVVDAAIVSESAAAEPWTTGARVALRALVEGLSLVAPRERVTVYADDRAAVMTVREWGPAWQRNGWRLSGRKGRPRNLDLVQEAMALYRARVNARVELDPAAARGTWCQYAHALASWRLFEESEAGEQREAGGRASA